MLHPRNTVVLQQRTFRWQYFSNPCRYFARF